MSREVLVAVLVTLIVGDAARSSRWGAARFARWAARRIYVADPGRSGKRSEEWDALITDAIPGDISAFCFGASLVTWALAAIVFRRGAAALSLVGHICLRIPGFRLTRRVNYARRLDIHRRACLALLAAAGQLRLCAAESAQLGQAGTDSYLQEIRRLAAKTQLQAASVALLGSDALAEPAERVTQAAARLSDEASRGAWPAGGFPGLGDLDESMRSFQRLAVGISRELSSQGITWHGGGGGGHVF